MIIGITGSIGSGKTIVAKLFGRRGFKVIDADKFYAGLYKKNKAMRKSIKIEFGTISRKKIKKIAFSNPNKLLKLNRITHPIILNEIKKSINQIKKENRNAKIIIDAPLLLESEAKSLVGKIIVVKCNEAAQLRRVLKKKKYSAREIKNILKSQMPLKEKLKYADFVVGNSGSLAETKKQVNEIIDKL